MSNTQVSTLLDVKSVLEHLSLEENMKVADLGCGSSGRFVFPCAEIVGSTGLVYAVDILKNTLDLIIRQAKENNLMNIKAVWSNLEVFGATKIPAGSIDVAILVNTLSQSQERVNIVREAIRLVKKGGRLLVAEWKKTATPLGPPLDKRVDSVLLKNGAFRLGLELDDEFAPGPCHWGLIFKKL
jgi:ubiquinone/menaquinone biosynthesis C-methylase UbiE